MVDDKEDKRNRAMQAWEVFLNEQEKRFGKESVQKWLRSLKVAQFDAANLYLEAEDSFQVSWFEEHIRPLLVSFKNNNDRPIRVHLTLLGQKQRIKKAKFFSSRFSIVSDSIDPEMTFENFFPFPANEMAYRLLVQTLTTSFPTYNPIFLYGNSSTGKSHLLHAAAAEAIKKGKKVFMVHADSFTEHVVGALRQGCMQEFRKNYRSVDLLIIDDVQVFSKKNATQEEFFHTFNTLHTSGKQILLSANLAPKLLNDIEPRLISRFEWGISVPLLDLQKEDLLFLFDKKCQHLGMVLETEARHFLLESFTYNFKKVLQALQALLVRSQKLPPKIDLSFLTSILPDLLEQEKRNALNAEKILKSVAHHYGLKVEDLLGASQAREVSLPRQVAMYYCRLKLKLPYMKIGQLFDRDHSTVMTSIKTIEKHQKTKEELSSSLIEISKSFF
jgi:chromosomal replication initiator protein